MQTGALLIIHGGGGSSGGEATPSSATSTAGTTTTTMTTIRDSNTVNRIVDGYFSLLDAWGLWHVRVQTNALYLKRSQSLAGKITPQVMTFFIFEIIFANGSIFRCTSLARIVLVPYGRALVDVCANECTNWAVVRAARNRCLVAPCVD